MSNEMYTPKAGGFVVKTCDVAADMTKKTETAIKKKRANGNQL